MSEMEMEETVEEFYETITTHQVDGKVVVTTSQESNGSNKTESSHGPGGETTTRESSGEVVMEELTATATQQDQQLGEANKLLSRLEELEETKTNMAKQEEELRVELEKIKMELKQTKEELETSITTFETTVEELTIVKEELSTTQERQQMGESGKLVSLQEELTKVKEELSRTKEKSTKTKDALQMTEEELERLRKELQKSKKELEKTTTTIETVVEELTTVREELTTTRDSYEQKLLEQASDVSEQLTNEVEVLNHCLTHFDWLLSLEKELAALEISSRLEQGGVSVSYDIAQQMFKREQKRAEVAELKLAEVTAQLLRMQSKYEHSTVTIKNTSRELVNTKEELVRTKSKIRTETTTTTLVTGGEPLLKATRSPRLQLPLDSVKKNEDVDLHVSGSSSARSGASSARSQDSASPHPGGPYLRTSGQLQKKFYQRETYGKEEETAEEIVESAKPSSGEVSASSQSYAASSSESESHQGSSMWSSFSNVFK